MKQMSEIKTENSEKTGWLVHYDLGSEARAVLYKTEKDDPATKSIKFIATNKIAAVRLKSTTMLHSLGLPSSNSVLLIPADVAEDSIDGVIKSVDKHYKELNELLVTYGLPEIGQPFIRKVAIVKFQFSVFQDMAQRKLMDRLDDQLNHLAEKIHELSSLEEKKKRATASRYKNELKNIEEMKDLAKKLGIVADEKFDLLSDMFKEAIKKVE
jgi:hypothetical protein